MRPYNKSIPIVLILLLLTGALGGIAVLISAQSADSYSSAPKHNLQPAKIGEINTSIMADKDSYVDAGSPDSNYGGKDWLKFGYYVNDFEETYLHFNFSDKPSGWTKAVISIDMYSVSETFEATVSVVDGAWDEYTIDWMNKPTHGDVIEELTIAEERIYKIDVSNYIEGNELSICINASDYTQNGYVQASSTEGYFLKEDAPQLIWTYEDELRFEISSPSASAQVNLLKSI